jgi:hypothetical protein
MNESTSMTAVDFARHVLGTNPFAEDRVTQVQTHQADVTTIHENAFKRLVRRIEDVRASKQTVGVLLTGPAGVGKSHVLARLFRWAREEGNATVVYLHNILASPERTGRYLLHATVNDLAGFRAANFAQSELYRLINLAIFARLEGKAKGMAPNLSVRREILKQIGYEIDPDQLVMPVFIAYLEQAGGANLAEEAAEARALAALQWLSGETIDPELARSIGIRVNSEDGACIPDDVAVQRTLDVICRLCAAANRPFVLCLDQVDNLSAERVKALARFLQAMIDNGQNLVVVTSGVKDSMDRLEREHVIPTAASDRIAQHRVNLQPISMKDARAIVARRIEKFCAPFAKVELVVNARKRDELVPLSETWWEKYSQALIETRPRDVVRAARDGWELEQERISELGVEAWLSGLSEGAVPIDVPPKPLPPLEERIDELVGKKLTEAVAARRLNPERLPPDADNLATLTLTLLEDLVDTPGFSLRGVETVSDKAKMNCYDLWVTEARPNGETVTNGVTFFTTDNAKSAVHALKRLDADSPPPTHQLFITDEERRPLRLGARGQEIYDGLRRTTRFQHLTLKFDDHAQLDAISSVLGAARVGDLDVEVERGSYRAITEEECRASLLRKGVYLNHPLLRQLLTEEVAPVESSPGISSGKSEQIRTQIRGELAMALAMTAREMATIILDRTGKGKEQHEKIWKMVKTVAEEMHLKNELFVTAQDDDLYLQLA